MTNPTLDVIQRLDRMERENPGLRRVGSALVIALAPAIMVGCASTSMPLLAPPLVGEVLGGPKDYQWKPFRWEAGKKLTYTYQLRGETTIGDRKVATNDSGYEFSLAGGKRTAKGLTQVKMTVTNMNAMIALSTMAIIGPSVGSMAGAPRWTSTGPPW